MFLALAMFMTSTSCGDITEVNNDPTRLSDVTLSLMAPIVLAGHYRNEGTNPPRVAGIIMQQLTGFDAQQADYTQYIIGEDAMNNYWRTGLYAGSLKDAVVMIEKAQEEGNSFYEGLGKLVLANGLADAASYFGDIPYSEAFKGTENLKPAYDSQESVYDAALGLLDQAIDDLQKNAGGHLGGDLVFGGDTEAWIKTANGLKARYLMHLQKRRGGEAQILALIEQSAGSIAEEATFTFGTAETENWTLAKFGRERPNTLIFNAGFAQRLQDDADPRLPYYGKFDGTSWLYWILGDAELVWARDNASIPLVSYSELQFLKAEALLRTGASDADVEAALEEAIKASMDLIGVPASEADTYIAANSSISGSFEQKLETIMNEAYVAYFGHNFAQTWANYRRTGYPVLTPNPQGANGFNPSGEIPKRFLYAGSETQTNGVSVQAARDRQNGALLDVDVWAFE